MEDNLEAVYLDFMKERKTSLFDRFKGYYRALVVETNDPLNMYRIRFKMPELHNFDLSPEQCPWAAPAFQHGGKGSGNWNSPTIGDIVWITFEKNHPYGPIWVGHADPTRRRYFKLHALYNKVQISLDEEGKPTDKPTDEPLDEYLAKDGRPYSLGYKDRYGTLFILDETGYFPKEHDIDPATDGIDAVSQGQFLAKNAKPEKNNPDRKMSAIITKYGSYMILADMGYKWDNEFSGDFEEDYDDEKTRAQNLIKLLNENEPNSIDRDQRRIEFRTDYGHKFEMRDVGWAQNGPILSKSRADDLFSDENSKSDFSTRDERWVKFRTKGGMLMQFMDMGNDPSADTFIRRKRIEEVGGKVDEEDNSWQGRDARQMRIVTRYGFKFVLDDRGSDEKDADTKNMPHGNGILIKGRRKAVEPKHGDTDSELGYGIDINEKDPLNRMLLYSPNAKCLELNDKYDYVMLCADMSSSISKPWQYLKENEFATAVSMTFKPEDDTYYLKLDNWNEYCVLGSPEQQAFEIRDGKDESEAFIEMRDIKDRATVHSEELKLSAFHDGLRNKYVVLDDKNKWILIHNLDGIIQIYAKDGIQVKSDKDINMQSRKFSIKCSQFAVDAGTQFVVDGGGFGGTGPMSAPQSNAYHIGCEPGGGAGPSSPKGSNAPPVPVVETPIMVPSKRKYKINSPYPAVSIEKIKGKE